MIAYCSDSAINRADIEAALEALSMPHGEDVPLIGVQAADAGVRVVFASRPMLALFGAADLDKISARISDRRDPGGRRLAELAHSLPAELGPRLERLRFYVGPVAETLTFLCRQSFIGRANEPVLIAAGLGARPLRAAAPTLGPAFAVAGAAPPVGDTATGGAEGAQPLTMRSLPEVEKILAARLEGRKAVRFLWRTDAADKVIEITPPLAEIVGAAAADLLGRDFGDIAKFLDRDPDGPLGRAFARRETFSGIEVLWPVAGAAVAVPVSLGAVPGLTAERHFDGYRGFGVIHTDRLVAAEPRTFMQADEAAEDAHAPEPPVANNVIHLRSYAPLAKANPSEAAGPNIWPSDLQPRRSEPLTRDEETAFQEIAAVLAEDVPEAEKVAGEGSKGDATEAAPAPSSEMAEKPPALSSRETEIARHAATIFDRLGFGILISRDHVPIYANRYLLDLLGYADEDALHAAGGLARIFELPPSANQAIALRTASGASVATRARIQTIDWDGLPATLLTLRQDEDKELRAGLESEVQSLTAEIGELKAILDTATDGLALVDEQGRILALNRSGEALFGYDQSEVAGQPFTRLFAPESQAKARDYFHGLGSNGVASLLNDGREVIGQARQGGAIPIFLTLGRIGTGAAKKYCALMRDMTHWKKVEQELEAARHEAERASALKSDFLAKVSHEIRTPLNAILGFAEVIIEERFGPIGNERYRDYLKDIHASGVHVMSLVNDLLDLSKIEAGRMDLDFIALDVGRVISDCVSIMQPQANRERVIMRLALAPNLPRILADERSLRQIVLNLLSNAVKFNEPGGQVIIATTLADDGHAVIRIRDTGIGMSESDIATALEPFRQLETTRQTDGTGLGLPLTKALVEANRASFSIKSKKNEGTMIEIAFPPERLLSRDPLSA